MFRNPGAITMTSALSIALLFLVSWTTAAEDPVHIMSTFEQPVTSSTLQWVSPPSPKPGSKEATPAAPADAVTGDDLGGNAANKRVVCRAMVTGFWVPGVLDDSEPEDNRKSPRVCQVSVYNQVTNHTKYQVLVNPESAARLAWQGWTTFSPTVALGAVLAGASLTDSYYVARVPEPSGSFRVGRLDTSQMLGHILVSSLDAKKEDSFDEGEVLTEIEPEQYELSGVKLNTARESVQRTRTHLGDVILLNENPDPEVGEEQVSSVVTYTAQHSVYWGQGRAVLKGHKTTIRWANGSLAAEIKWGLMDSDNVQAVHQVETHLPPGAAQNVSVWGNQTVTDTPYTGTLVAIYADGSSRSRAVSGTRVVQGMRDVSANLGPAYWLGNDTLLPTTTTTTTTTTTIEPPEPTQPEESVTIPNSVSVLGGPQSDQATVEINGGESRHHSVFVLIIIPILLLVQY